jgi:hypothetical protein
MLDVPIVLQTALSKDGTLALIVETSGFRDAITANKDDQNRINPWIEHSRWGFAIIEQTSAGGMSPGVYPSIDPARLPVHSHADG